MPGTKCNTKKPNPAANTIDTAIINRPEAIPPSLKAIKLVISIKYNSFEIFSNCMNYSIYPNLLFIVYKSKNIDENEIIKPIIINGFDFSVTFLSEILVDEDVFLSLSLLIRFEKGLFTLKNKFNKSLAH